MGSHLLSVSSAMRPSSAASGIATVANPCSASYINHDSVAYSVYPPTLIPWTIMNP